MKTLNFITILLLFNATLSAQTLSGTYTASGQKLVFKGDSLSYVLNTGGCLVNVYQGKATFRIVNDRLFIEPVVKNDVASFVKAVPATNRDTAYIKIMADSNKQAVIGASVIMQRAGHTVWGMATNLKGEVKMPIAKILATDSISVAYIGYRKVVFKPEPGNIYVVALAPGPEPVYQHAYVTNKGKGYEFKTTADGLLVNMEQRSDCSMAARWITFKKGR